MVQVWDLERQQHRSALVGHCCPVQRLQLAEGLLCSIAGQIVRLWDPKTLTCQSVLHLSKTGGALWALTATCCDNQLYLLAGGQVWATFVTCRRAFADLQAHPFPSFAMELKQTKLEAGSIFSQSQHFYHTHASCFQWP